MGVVFEVVTSGTSGFEDFDSNPVRSDDGLDDDVGTPTLGLRVGSE